MNGTTVAVTILSIGGAILPAWLLVGYFRYRDRKRPEPRNLIITALILGSIALIPATVIELLLGNLLPRLGPLADAMVQGFLVAGVVEEGLKFACVAIWLFQLPEFDEVADGIVYTVCVSLGFALVENVLYSFGQPVTMLLRAFTAVPMHAAASGVMGYFLGRAKMGKRHFQYIGLVLAILIHGLYDTFAMLDNRFSWLLVPVVVFACIAVLALFRRALAFDDARIEARQKSDLP